MQKWPKDDVEGLEGVVFRATIGGIAVLLIHGVHPSPRSVERECCLLVVLESTECVSLIVCVYQARDQDRYSTNSDVYLLLSRAWIGAGAYQRYCYCMHVFRACLQNPEDPAAAWQQIVLADKENVDKMRQFYLRKQVDLQVQFRTWRFCDVRVRVRVRPDPKP